MAVGVVDDLESVRVGVRAVDELVLLQPMHLEAFPFKLVRLALHVQLVLEELLGYNSLARDWILEHTSKEALLVESALFDLLEVEVLSGQIMERLNLVLGHVCHPRQLHHFLE